MSVWIVEVEKLVDMFRETRNLFLTSRVGCLLCFRVGRWAGQYDVADEILQHIMVSNTYQAHERQDSIRLAIITPIHGIIQMTVNYNT